MLVVFIYSCTSDFEVLEHEHRNDNLVSWKTFKRETGVTNARGDLQTQHFVKNLPQFRGVELSDFVIDTTYILKYINDEGKSTYSFSVQLLEPIDEKTLYNLVFRKENEVWEKSVVSFELENNNPKSLVNFNNTFDSASFSITNNSLMWCFSVTTYLYCTLTNHCTGQAGCDFYSENGCPSGVCRLREHVNAYPCSSGAVYDLPPLGGPPSPGGSPPSGGGADDSGGSSSGSQYDFAPNIKSNLVINGPGNSTVAADPCIVLEKIQSNQPGLPDNQQFMHNFNQINTQASFSAPQESGFGVVYNEDGQRTFVPGIPSLSSHLKIHENSTSGWHVHTDFPVQQNGALGISVKLPSPEDTEKLFGRMRIICSSRNTPNVNPVVGMISSEGIFAIVLNDNSIQIPDFEGKMKKFNKQYFNKSLNILLEYPSDSFSDKTQRKNRMQIMYLKLLKKYQLNTVIDFLEGEVQNGVLTWKKKKLNSNNEIIETPC